MKVAVNSAMRWLKLALVMILAGGLAACDPQVYGSIGVSSGYSSWDGGYGSPRVGGSISIGGRIM